MRPSKFEYHRAGSVSEAVNLLAQNDGAKALAGGHSIIPAMNLRLAQPEMLVDLGRLNELKGINFSGTLKIGALTTHAEVASSPLVQKHAPALASAASKVGDHLVRNRGTLGGNLAHADPASDPPTVVLASGGTIHAQGPNGSRAIKAADFFIDSLTVDLQPGEVITTVELPDLQNLRSAYVKFPHPASRYALVGVCVILQMSGNTCQSASVAVGGAVAKATKSPGAEAALTGKTLDDTVIESAAQALMSDVQADVIGDIFAPESYRLAMVGVYLKRAVREALGR